MVIASTTRLVALPGSMCLSHVVALSNGTLIAATVRAEDDPRLYEQTCDLIILEEGMPRWQALCVAPLSVGGMVALGDGQLLFVDQSARQSGVLNLATIRWRTTKLRGLGVHPAFTLIPAGPRSVLLAASTAEDQPVKHCALYDVQRGEWSNTGAMRRGFGGMGEDALADAVSLSETEVLFVGGRHAELYDASTGRWKMAGRVNGWHCAPIGQRCALTYSGEMYDAATGRWTVVEGGYRAGGPMVVQRDGRVFAFSRDGIEMVDLHTRSWAPVSAFPDAVSWRYAITPAHDHSVLIWPTEAPVTHTVLWSWTDNTPARPQTEVEAFLADLPSAAALQTELAERLYHTLADVTSARARATHISSVLAEVGVSMQPHAIWRIIRDWPRQLSAPAPRIAPHEEEDVSKPIEAASAAITFVIGDATQPQGPGPHVIAHICNDRGGWGRGFVNAVTRMSPAPEQAYRAWYRGRKTNNFALGALQIIGVSDTLSVANMVAQKGYRTLNGRPPIRYEALRQALNALAVNARKNRASVHMPRIGCGLAGGDWPSVQIIVEETLLAAGVSVTVYDLPS